MKGLRLSVCFMGFLFSVCAKAQLIQNVQIIDGTGAPAYTASLRIHADTIQAIGQLIPKPNEQLINGKGLVLSPGFIDSHSHHFNALQQNPSGIPNASQGVTSIVIGQDGEGILMDSLQKIMQQHPIAINVASYTGHTSLREMVMGENDCLRNANVEELEQMKKLLKGDMQNGSLGLSTGLEYEQAFYSSKQEVLALAGIAAQSNGSYISHIRSEDVNLEEAIDEIIEIGFHAKMPVQIAHIKIGMQSKWGKAQTILNKLDSARAKGISITADFYPYNFWNSTLRVLFPARDYKSLISAEFAVKELMDPAASVLVQYAPVSAYKGKTISQIASIRNASPAQTLIDLVEMAAKFKNENPNYSNSIEAIAAKGMHEQDLARFLVWPHTNICSDGNAGAHPRGYGAFTKILSQYVRKEKLLNLEEAIYKMTGLTAAHLGLFKRGVIAKGNYADLVLFNPATVQDNATIQNSHALSTGIEMVWVNGKLIYQNQLATGNYPGVLIKRSK